MAFLAKSVSHDSSLALDPTTTHEEAVGQLVALDGGLELDYNDSREQVKLPSSVVSHHANKVLE